MLKIATTLETTRKGGLGHFPIRAAVAVIALLLTTGGCSTASVKWGTETTWRPGWQRLKAAAANAATDPGTWIPLAGAGLVLATGNDERLSDYYWDKAPVFGNARQASEQSDRLREELFTAHIVSMLMTPSGAAGGEWLVNKAKGVLVQEGALGLTRITNNLIKKNVDRNVPSYDPTDPDNESFPSNHATEPFAAAALIRRNLEATALPAWARNTLAGGAYVAAVGAAWGRVEMGLHYPSDQLASAAIGNFVALMINDTFMGGKMPLMKLRVGRESAWAGMQWGF